MTRSLSYKDMARWPWQRCVARVPPNDTGYFGRCDRKKRHDGVHWLERGMLDLYWSTEFQPEHADDTEYCRRCGGPNVVWSAASPLWNYVMRGNDINGDSRYSDLVCIACFIRCAVEAGLPETGWRLTLVPEPEGLVYETPSGRVWDEEKFLWVEDE